MEEGDIYTCTCNIDMFQLSHCVDFLWRFAKATYIKSGIEGDNGMDEKKKELVYTAKDLAVKAEQVDENNPEVQKW